MEKQLYWVGYNDSQEELIFGKKGRIEQGTQFDIVTMLWINEQEAADLEALAKSNVDKFIKIVTEIIDKSGNTSYPN